MRLPRGIKVLNGMTWVLPPEILLRTFGTEVPNLAGDGDLDSQLRQVEVALPIFRGISPSLEEMNPLLLAKIRSGVELYKQQLRPILHNSVVYHHTPLTDFSQETPWVVLEYAYSGFEPVDGDLSSAPRASEIRYTASFLEDWMCRRRTV